MTGSSPSPRDLVARFGSPLYVYDAETVRRRWETLRGALPSGAEVFYAVKANPSLGLLALLRSLGAGAEIASEGELLAAREAGFPPERILYAGPGKRAEEVEAAVAAGILAVNAESREEILLLDEIGRRRGTPVRCGVRVHVPWSAGEGRTIIGGGSETKFGIAEEEARGSAPAWAGLSGVRVAGLHVFNASNVLDAGALVAGARRTFALAEDLVAAGLPLEWVDIGGGLGVPYAAGERPLDVRALGQGLGDVLEASRTRTGVPLGLLLEPGRYLVAEAGTYLVTVLYRKRCGEATFLVTDGGVHHLLRPALIGQPHPVIRAAPVAGRGRLRRFRVAGPLCTSLDGFGDHDLPEETGPGDLLAVNCAGAYGFTEAMPGFLSHPVPAEVLLRDGEAHLLRARRPASSHLEGQVIPPGLEPPGPGH